MAGHAVIIEVLATGYLVAGIAIAWLYRALTRARHQAAHDGLTGLPTRRTAIRYLAERRRSGRATTAIMLDLDRFKAVNDNYGHWAGDQLLTAVGTRLASRVRPLDGVAARLGGDEFLLMVPAAPPAEHAKQVRGILDDLATPVSADSHFGPVTLHPSATAGISTAADSDWIALVSAADRALHEAKLIGTRYSTADATLI